MGDESARSARSSPPWPRVWGGWRQAGGEQGPLAGDGVCEARSGCSRDDQLTRALALKWDWW